MKEIILFPLITIMLLGFVPQLLTVAESSQDKALVFTDDMNKAIDCATRGIDLRICSPNLYNHDFSKEINETIEINKEIREMIHSQDINNLDELKNLNISSITQEDNTIIIKLN
jgi:hypothetical protein